jgi:hypothetical protein
MNNINQLNYIINSRLIPITHGQQNQSDTMRDCAIILRQNPTQITDVVIHFWPTISGLLQSNLTTRFIILLNCSELCHFVAGGERRA